MAVLKCKTCGGNIEVGENKNISLRASQNYNIYLGYVYLNADTKTEC